MGKIRDLLEQAPFKITENRVEASQASRMFTLLYDYEANSKVTEFSRVGDSISDCTLRLQLIFDAVDKLVERGGNLEIANSFKKLLLLASTPLEIEQYKAVDLYEESPKSSIVEVSFDDIVTIEEATEIGTRGYWNQ